MAIIKYQLGQERDVVLVKGNYDDSIFKDQYSRALTIVKDFLRKFEIDSKKLKPLIFSGDRGEGKTSCMLTVRNILIKSSDEGNEQHSYLKSLGLDDIVYTKFISLELIDPSFFDEAHNVLELIIGQMYSEIKKIPSHPSDLKNKIFKQFQKVKQCLCYIHDKNFVAIDEMHDLDVLSISIQLRDSIATLIHLYLELFGADVLIIPVDDIDLDMSRAFKMCEQIRKYLCVPKCIVMFGVKISQLQDAVSIELKRQIQPEKGNPLFDNEIRDMTRRYLDKLLPVSCRIDMPKAYSIGNVKFEIRHENEIVFNGETLKDSILRLIFLTSRYLFYNPLGDISPIVPNNLREMFGLIGLLASMKIVTDSRDSLQKEALDENKNLFKHYFFNDWKNRFDQDTRNRLDKLINFDFGTSFNREIVAIIKMKFKATLNKDYKQVDDDDSDDNNIANSENNIPLRDSKDIPADPIIRSIIDDNNFGYNLTAGDVFYLFSKLECETLSEEDFALVFFLKSLYSMRLYEAYDEMTEEKGRIYPMDGDSEDDKIRLSVIDKRFAHSNKYQQLTGGSLFTFAPGELMPLEEGKQPWDLRIIDAQGSLHELIDSLKDNIVEITSNEYDRTTHAAEIKEFNEKLNVAEFFILTTKCILLQKQLYRRSTKDNDLNEILTPVSKLRANSEPFHYSSFSKKSKYYIFDVLAPFSTLINPEFAYKRFEAIDDDFYRRIENYEGSLLFKIFAGAENSKDYIDHKENKDWTRYHRILSQVTIRNAEVLTALRDNIVFNRFKDKGKSSKATIHKIYEQMRDSGMSTYKIDRGSNTHNIDFSFLEPIINFLSEINKESASRDAQNYFRSIFDRVPVNIDMTFDSNDQSLYNNKTNDNAASTLRDHLSKYLKQRGIELNAFEKKLIFPDKPSGAKYSTDEAKETNEKLFIILRDGNENLSQRILEVFNPAPIDNTVENTATSEIEKASAEERLTADMAKVNPDAGNEDSNANEPHK